MSDLEEESASHSRARLWRRVRRGAVELALSIAFIALVLVAGRIVDAEGKESAAALAAIIAAAGVLAAWFLIYVRWHLTHDEFERRLELQSVALGAGVTIVLATALGLAEMVLGGPSLPIVFVAPAFSLVYSAVRLVMGRAYR
jgi:hypothetical protein